EQGDEKSYQFVINGENFYALETLLYAYEGKVDCIYIDPPYNSGAKDWKYNNDYVAEDDRYRHSKWLSFIDKRLRPLHRRSTARTRWSRSPRMSTASLGATTGARWA